MSATHSASEHSHPSIDTIYAAASISRLHDQVCTEKRRIEITRAGCDETCVMISRKELESMESALQILADTEAFAEMCNHLKKLLAAANEVYGDPLAAE